MNAWDAITVDQLAKLEPPVDLIDVRTPAEYREVHSQLASRNCPLDSLNPRQVMEDRNGAADQPLYVICKGGGRSTKACRKLVDAGFTNIVNVVGGTEAWVAAGLPVVRGRKTVSLERQVRIVAGFLALLGGVLAMTVNVYWAALPVLIGGGLMFAGITDTCGMAMMLARMPWNQVRQTAAPSSDSTAHSQQQRST